MNKRILAFVLVVISILSLVGCSRKTGKDDFKLFYLNIDITGTQAVSYDFKQDGMTQKEAIDKLLDKLSDAPDDSKLRKTIPDGVEVLSHEETGYNCVIDFSKEYYDMTPAEEVLMRSAVVRTITQLDSVMYISFTVESAPLLNSDDEVIGSMSADSFVENPGEQINSSVEETLTLYFADKDGTELEKQKRVIHYSSNISLEKLVIEQLIEGPKNSKLEATLPSTTKLINISVMDGICYLNLDSTFKNNLNNELKEDVILYSIVNSLTSLPNVDKVQISVNGENSGTFIYNFKLSDMYEFNKELVQDADSENNKTTETQTEQENQNNK